MKSLSFITLMLVFFLFSACNKGKAIFKNPDVSIEKRVNDLLSRMTIEKKVAKLSMKSLGNLKMDEMELLAIAFWKLFLKDKALVVLKAHCII